MAYNGRQCRRGALGVERTSAKRDAMSANDPKRTSPSRGPSYSRSDRSLRMRPLADFTGDVCGETRRFLLHVPAQEERQQSQIRYESQWRRHARLNYASELRTLAVPWL